MDWVNRQTAHERPDLLEWRKRQGKAAWYGLWSIIIGSSVTFSGLSFFRLQIPKKYIPLLSLTAGACSGWYVSHRIMRSSSPSDVGSAVPDISQSLENNASAMQESKFGDKDFIKE
ncbi:unnamed protein product [Pocillopora meandrina]|uniref:Uncharacterized protein n=1 Tax=Pocillopora meandrina TaxID=46732 RepID=A0AAU9VT01_9CNID|nr:unnamed protein product [Pocillopora meandrina]